MNGYSAVQGEDAIKIVPSAAARQSGLEIREGKELDSVKPEDRMITQVIPLEYASADEVRNLFASSVSKDGMIVSYKPTNHLIITDRASNIQPPSQNHRADRCAHGRGEDFGFFPGVRFGQDAGR